MNRMNGKRVLVGGLVAAVVMVWAEGARPDPAGHNAWMLKWVITTLVALVLLTGLMPLLARIGLGHQVADILEQPHGRASLRPSSSHR